MQIACAGGRPQRVVFCVRWKGNGACVTGFVAIRECLTIRLCRGENGACVSWGRLRMFSVPEPYSQTKNEAPRPKPTNAYIVRVLLFIPLVKDYCREKRGRKLLTKKEK